MYLLVITVTDCDGGGEVGASVIKPQLLFKHSFLKILKCLLGIWEDGT